MSTQEGEHPRISKDEIYPEVGNTAEKLAAAIPVFGEELVNAVVNALNSGQIREATITLESTGENPQKLGIRLTNPTGENNLDIVFTGDWNQKEKQKEGNPLIANYDGRFWRRENPEATEPIAKEHDFILPDGRIGMASAGKNQIWALRLSKDTFPQGGEITQFPIEDGAEVKKGETVLCYVRKVEKVK